MARTPRLTAADFDQELLILFDAYVHGDIDRRGFLDQAARFAVGGLTAAGILASLSPDFAIAQVVPQGDARISTERVEFASPNGYGTVKAYVAKPAGASGQRGEQDQDETKQLFCAHEKSLQDGTPSSIAVGVRERNPRVHFSL